MAENLAAGNDAVALLGNTLGTVTTLVVLILVSLRLISGAHLNPAISLVFLLRREVTAPTFIGYVTAQTCGAVLGVFLAHAMFDLPLLQGFDSRAGQHRSVAVRGGRDLRLSRYCFFPAS